MFARSINQAGISTVSTLLKVFVYGTLKSGEPNHHWLTTPENGTAMLLGPGLMAVKYPLVIATRYNIPFLLDEPARGHNVAGEVYEIDEKMLSNLDILEGYPTFYTRRIESIMMRDAGDDLPRSCWTYFLQGHKPHLLELPFLKSYSSTGDHGLPYQERYRRDPHFDYKVEVQDIPQNIHTV